jgi:hypothetical protein
VQSAALLPQKLSFLAEKENALYTFNWRTEHFVVALHLRTEHDTTKMIPFRQRENITKVMLLIFAEHHLSGTKKAENRNTILCFKCCLVMLP